MHSYRSYFSHHPSAVVPVVLDGEASEEEEGLAEEVQEADKFFLRE
jgi:hypothetical protein